MTLARTYRFTALFMAFLLFLSTSGMTMDMHFCQGKLKRVNLFGKAKTCAEVVACYKICQSKSKSKASGKKSCHSNDGDHSGCCNNAGLILDLDYDFGGFVTSELGSVQEHLLTPIVSDVLPSKVVQTLNVPYLNYKPPLLTRDIQVLVQSFLI